MALIDVVKWEVNSSEFCYKFPSDDLRIGTQLVVYTAQTAFFVKGGQICDEFSAGTYTIKTENIPILNKLVGLPFGNNTPFKCEVWFVNQISKLDIKWGTIQPIQVEDPRYKIVIPVRAFGQYGIRVSNPRKFLETLIGNMSIFTVDTIIEYFKGKLMVYLSSIIASKITQGQTSILDINTQLVELSEDCQTNLNKTVCKYGIEILDFALMSINVPANDPSLLKLKEAKDMAARLKITGRDVYQMERSFDVLDKAAANTGAGGQMMAMGAGLSAGMGIGNVMGGMAAQNIQTNPIAPPPIPQETTYFVYYNGQQVGGQTTQHLAALLTQGQINLDSLVWKVGLPAWVKLRDLPELAALCNTQTPPPIPPQH